MHSAEYCEVMLMLQKQLAVLQYNVLAVALLIPS